MAGGSTPAPGTRYRIPPPLLVVCSVSEPRGRYGKFPFRRSNGISIDLGAASAPAARSERRRARRLAPPRSVIVAQRALVSWSTYNSLPRKVGRAHDRHRTRLLRLVRGRPNAKQTSPTLWRGSQGFFDVTGVDSVEITIRH